MAASSAVKCALKNGVAVLHITSPPVNALGAAVRAGLVAGVEHAIGASAATPVEEQNRVRYRRTGLAPLSGAASEEARDQARLSLVVSKEGDKHFSDEALLGSRETRTIEHEALVAAAAAGFRLGDELLGVQGRGVDLRFFLMALLVLVLL